MEALVALLIAIVAMVIARQVAQRKGRSSTWAFFTFLFSPTLLLLLLMPSLRADEVPNFIAQDTLQPSGTQITVEKRQRGFFGKIVSIVFWGWQVVMAFWFVSYLVDISQQYGQIPSDAGRIGTTIGGTIGVSIILWVWLFGAIILGLMMFFTRGEKITITRVSP